MTPNCYPAAAQRQPPTPPPPTSDSQARRPHTLSAQLGVGWFAFATDLDVDINNDDPADDYDYAFDGGPAASLAYDYRVGRVVSVGAAVARQGNRLTDFRRDGAGLGEPADRLAGDARVTRTFLSGRLLLHYGRARSVEFYSGLRAGVTLYRTRATGEVDREGVGFFGDPGSDGSHVLPHLTIVPFGFRGYLGEHVSLGAETMFGSPHVVAAQLGWRF